MSELNTLLIATPGGVTSEEPFGMTANKMTDPSRNFGEPLNSPRGDQKDVLISAVATALGFLVIALQRLSLPIPGLAVPVVAVVVAPFLAAALWYRVLNVRRTGAILYVLLIAVAVTSFRVNLDSAIPVSITSLLFLATIYSVVVVLPNAQNRDSAVNIGRSFFSGVTLAAALGAILALVQAASQWLQRGYPDPIAALPQTFQLQGYHSHYTTQWIPRNLNLPVKPNGMIFLEPSFLSLYASIALVIALHRLLHGDRKLVLLPLIAILFVGICISLSTSGLPCLAIGLVFMIREIIRRLFLVLALVGVLVAGLVSGLLDGVIAKALEGFGANTSSGLRISEPYKYLPNYWLDKPIFGNGPGSVTRIIEASGLLQLQSPAILRMLVEYGIAGFVIWALIVCLAIITSRAPWSIRIAVLAAYLIPTEGILSPVVVALILIGIPLWSTTTSNHREPATAVPEMLRTKGGRHRADPAAKDQWSPVKRP
jgi:hypothetical protein